jgi:hypothetical protein
MHTLVRPHLALQSPMHEMQSLRVRPCGRCGSLLDGACWNRLQMLVEPADHLAEEVGPLGIWLSCPCRHEI